MSCVVVSAESVMICCARVDAEAARTLQSALAEYGCPAAILVGEPQSPARTVNFTACRVMVLLCSAMTHRVNDLLANVQSAGQMGTFILPVILEPSPELQRLQVLFRLRTMLPKVEADRSFPDEQVRLIFEAIEPSLWHVWTVKVRRHIPPDCGSVGRRIGAAIHALQKASRGRLGFEVLAPGSPPEHGDRSIFVSTEGMGPSLLAPFDAFARLDGESPLSSVTMVSARGDEALLYSTVIMIRDARPETWSPEDFSFHNAAANAFLRTELIGPGRSVIKSQHSRPPLQDMDQWIAGEVNGILRASLFRQMNQLRPPPSDPHDSMDLDQLVSRCYPPFCHKEWLGEKLTPARAEAIFLIARSGDLGPWKSFRRLLQPGDELWTYGHEQNPEGARCSQSRLSGLALVRNGEIFADLRSG